MIIENKTESISRQEFTKLKFDHQVKKAYRKGKLMEVVYVNGSEENMVLIDPALLNYQYDKHPASIKDFEHTVLMMQFLNAKQTNPRTVSKIFKVNAVGNPIDGLSDLLMQGDVEKVFDLIIDSDPTPNKEYVQWLLIMYTRLLKDREPETTLDSVENKFGGFAYTFFENLMKLQEAFKIFHKFKTTKLLFGDDRDIYTFKTVDDFVHKVFALDIQAPAELNMAILDNKEWESINKKDSAIVFQNKDWIIIHTATKDGNNAFGDKTTWCTAGTKYGHMFDTYARQGNLYVLIKNELGSGNKLNLNPLNRLQFHFETDNYRDALDKSIKVEEFFKTHMDIKEFFRPNIMKKLDRLSKVPEIVTVLKRFSMVQELIPVLKDMNIKKLDLSDVINQANVIELKDLGQIKTLEELIIRKSGLTEIPEAIRHLTNLTSLRLRDNLIEKIPDWFHELKNLRVLNLMQNNFTEQVDLSGLTNIIDVNLAFNPKIRELPKGLSDLTQLTSLDVSLCNISEITDDIMACTNLIQLNITHNKNLSKIPLQIMELPQLLYIGLDDTNISTDTIKKLKVTKKPEQVIVAK